MLRAKAAPEIRRPPAAEQVAETNRSRHAAHRKGQAAALALERTRMADGIGRRKKEQHEQRKRTQSERKNDLGARFHYSSFSYVNKSAAGSAMCDRTVASRTIARAEALGYAARRIRLNQASDVADCEPLIKRP